MPLLQLAATIPNYWVYMDRSLPSCSQTQVEWQNLLQWSTSGLCHYFQQNEIYFMIACHLAFSLLQSAITCFEGSNSSNGYACHWDALDFATTEGHIPPEHSNFFCVLSFHSK